MKKNNLAPIFQDLDLHIKECDYRYQKIETKLDTLDDRLARIEQLVLQIRENVRG